MTEDCYLPKVIQVAYFWFQIPNSLHYASYPGTQSTLFQIYNDTTPVIEPSLGLFTWYVVKPIYWHSIVVKESTVYCKAPSKENRHLMLKRPKPLDGFQGRVFKDSVRERVPGCAISSCTVLWLADGEVTGWCFRNLSYQPSSSNLSGAYVLVVSS